MPSVTTDVPSSYRPNELDLEISLVMRSGLRTALLEHRSAFRSPDGTLLFSDVR